MGEGPPNSTFRFILILFTCGFFLIIINFGKIGGQICPVWNFFPKIFPTLPAPHTGAIPNIIVLVLHIHFSNAICFFYSPSSN